MPRPQKNGMDYFPHDVDASSDEKIEAMRTLFGNDGYAFYFILLERIYRSDDCELVISAAETQQIKAETGQTHGITHEEMVLILSRKVGVSTEKFEQMLDMALRIGLFDEQAYNVRGVLTSEGIKARAQAVLEKRIRERNRYQEHRKADDSNGENSDFISVAEITQKSDNSARKEKERKGEKRERSLVTPPDGGELTLGAPTEIPEDVRKKSGATNETRENERETLLLSPAGDRPTIRKAAKRSPQAKEAAAYLKQKLVERGVTVFERDWMLKNSAIAETLLRDGLSPEDIYALIDWCLADAFWGHKIHDLLKVRDLAPRWQQLQQQRQKPEKRSKAVMQLFDEKTCESWVVPWEDAEDIRCGRKPWPAERDAYLRELEEVRKAWQSKEQIS